ncbi:MAG: cytochrome C oxidase subunit IV family protein [Bryobacteraceae bacterium]|nr:cytochrome C oxidase subunit IV family protein [Bryobacteraceae bacterium]
MEAHSYSHARKTYSLVLAALMALTVITVAVSGIHFGSPAINVVVALTIASVKATLVALFFMHLLYDKRINAIIFVTGALMLGIFLIFILLDVETRDAVRPPTRSVPPAAAAPAP